MRTDILRKTALTAAGLAYATGAIAHPLSRRPHRPRPPPHPHHVGADRPQAPPASAN